MAILPLGKGIALSLMIEILTLRAAAPEKRIWEGGGYVVEVIVGTLWIYLAKSDCL